MPRITESRDEDRVVTELLGERPVGSEPVRWGFDADTRLATLKSGRCVLVHRRPRDVDGGQPATAWGAPA